LFSAAVCAGFCVQLWAQAGVHNAPPPGHVDTAPPANAPAIDQEARILQEEVSQVGDSPVDFIRAAERHLRQYPQSARRPNLEKAIFQAAVDARDNRRVIEYGQKVLERDGSDLTLLDRVARALLASDSGEAARKSLEYSEKFEKLAREKSIKAVVGEERDEADRTLARALVLEARAWGNEGDLDKAVALAHKSYETYPTAEAAREAGRWEVRQDRMDEAIAQYADAFSIPDAKVTPEDRHLDRETLGELYRKQHSSEAGLGDLMLLAYDRTAKAVAAREAIRVAGIPNAGVKDAFEYRLAGVRGNSLKLADFRGKVMVLDFWATWCQPCRAQHPLLEQLKTKYKNDDQVSFFSINSDDNHELVKPFLQQMKWSDDVYFEDGLTRFYRIKSIPTTMIFNRRGELASRMPGLVADHFVEHLTEKIEEARKE
jgi:thiol-disulfide isomerase/thioredoxin